MRLSQIKLNILANFAGKGWNALMLVALVPLYIRVLGIEAYGLIGFFTTLQAVFALLDLGLSTTLNRETARLSARADSAQERRSNLSDASNSLPSEIAAPKRPEILQPPVGNQIARQQSVPPLQRSLRFGKDFHTSRDGLQEENWRRVFQMEGNP